MEKPLSTDGKCEAPSQHPRPKGLERPLGNTIVLMRPSLSTGKDSERKPERLQLL